MIKIFKFKKTGNKLVSTVVEQKKSIVAESPKAEAPKVETVKAEAPKETPKPRHNVTTYRGAFNQLELDGDVDAYTNNLAAIRANEPKAGTQKNSSRFTITDGMSVSSPKSNTRLYSGGKRMEILNDIGTVKVETLADRVNLGSGECFYFSKQGYYIMRQAGKSYFLRATDKCLPARIMASLTPSSDAAKPYTGNIVVENDLQNKYRELTQTEIDSILKEQPSEKELLSIFVLMANAEKLQFDTAKAVVVW